MKLVVELLNDHGQPFSTEQATKLLDVMLQDTEELYGCLELADMDGRAVLARVVGRVEAPGGCDSPYEILELETS